MQNSHYITLIVYPFENLSMEKELDIFCRSFSEDLVIELSRFRQLRVIKYPDFKTSVDFQQITDKFKNRYYVQGTFRAEKETVRINVQLFDNENGHLIWGNRLDGNLTDLGEI